MKRKISKWLFAVLLMIVSALCLVGCGSFDKEKSYFNIQAQYDKGEEKFFFTSYDSVNNVTTIRFFATVKNDTVYDINGFSITVGLYDADGKFVEKVSYDIEHVAKSGETSEVVVERLKVPYEVGRVEYEAWQPSYDSWWKTFKYWLIFGGGGLVVIIIGFCVYENLC